MSTKRTYQPSRTRRLKSLGYRARKSTKAGQRILKSRTLKGRYRLTVASGRSFR